MNNNTSFLSGQYSQKKDSNRLTTYHTCQLLYSPAHGEFKNLVSVALCVILCGKSNQNHCFLTEISILYLGANYYTGQRTFKPLYSDPKISYGCEFKCLQFIFSIITVQIVFPTLQHCNSEQKAKTLEKHYLDNANNLIAQTSWVFAEMVSRMQGSI